MYTYETLCINSHAHMHIHIRSKGKSMSKYSEIPAVRTLVADLILNVGFNKTPYKTAKQPGLLSAGSLCKIHTYICSGLRSTNTGRL